MCIYLAFLALTFHDSYYHYKLIGSKQCLPCINQSYLKEMFGLKSLVLVLGPTPDRVVNAKAKTKPPV